MTFGTIGGLMRLNKRKKIIIKGAFTKATGVSIEN
jgi:hypothetical protein